jgi:hypothetical protein
LRINTQFDLLRRLIERLSFDLVQPYCVDGALIPFTKLTVMGLKVSSILNTSPALEQRFLW